jgi:hypothetical protein
MKIFMICTPDQILRAQARKRGCDMYGGEEKSIYGFYGETRREEITLIKYLDIKR